MARQAKTKAAKKVIRKAAKKASKKHQPGMSARSYSSPELSGLYPQPPFHYREVTQSVVAFKTDPKVLRSLVPKPLTPNKGSIVSYGTSEFLCSGFGHYFEASIHTDVTYKGRTANYSIYMLLDDDVATGAGREIWGFPKKLGRLSMAITDDVVYSKVERGGITIIESAVQLRGMMEPEELGGSPEWMMHKVVPNCSLAAPPDVNQIVSTTLTDIEVGKVHTGPATLKFNPSPADRLHEIPIKSIVGGFYFDSSFTLHDGEIVHDFLA